MQSSTNKDKKREFEFLIKGKDIILIKYCILFLTTYYGQLIFMPIYFCKKFSFNFFNNT